MNNRIATFAVHSLAVFALANEPAVALQPPPEATVTATKGPIQLTLRLYKKTVKAKKSLWYHIELKNAGRKKIAVEDRIFKDPWAMHQNILHRYGIYIDIASADPRYKGVTIPNRQRERDGLYSPPLREGAGQVRWDFEGPPGQPIRLSEEENKDLEAFEAKLDKQGLSFQQKSIAIRDWKNRLYDKKVAEESADPKKQLWLQPGASTRTFAWAYWDPDPNADHSRESAEEVDEVPPVGDYTQLWSYFLIYPGTYRVRAIYNHAYVESEEQLKRKYGITKDSWDVDVKTPFIDVTVLP